MPQPVGIAPKSAMNSPLEYDFFELMRTLTGYLVSLSDRSSATVAYEFLFPPLATVLVSSTLIVVVLPEVVVRPFD